eukprot:8058222-Pyramimonas_sp.AAC.1
MQSTSWSTGILLNTERSAMAAEPGNVQSSFRRLKSLQSPLSWATKLSHVASSKRRTMRFGRP